MSPVPSGETTDTPSCATVAASGAPASTCTALQRATLTTNGAPSASPASAKDLGTTVRAWATETVVMLASSEQSANVTSGAATTGPDWSGPTSPARSAYAG